MDDLPTTKPPRLSELAATAVRCASELAPQPRRPWGDGDVRVLCDAVEEILLLLLRDEDGWPRHEVVDGLIPLEVDWTPARVVVRGAMWIIGGKHDRAEPCEVDVLLAAPAGPALLVRLSDERGPSSVGDPRRVQFPTGGSWGWEYSSNGGT